ncbi:CpsD/CapB family tyrosine-protein kinase [Salinisphaera sp. T31B1]|uniref:CpsD/CapB family tyrosine-protein kinase n=1 Tax=Salinisphaera sp. T31B1 TaxID=727963 RepID=UPI003341B5A4
MADSGIFNGQEIVRVGHIDPSVAVIRDPAGSFAEHLRTIGMRLLVGPGAEAARALAVVSPSHGDGRSTLAANLAVVFAQAGRRTVLIDADLRRPFQHRLFGCDPKPGFAGFDDRIDERPLARPVDDVPGLYLITAGRSTDAEFDPAALAPARFARLLSLLTGQVDQVVIDTPPGLHYADGPGVAAQTGAALMVVRCGHTGIARARRLADEVQAMGATVLGTVLNHG